MSNQVIEFDIEVTFKFINDLKSLYDELNGINIQNTGMTSTGLCASEVQNTVQALLKYKEMLANLIEQSRNFANIYYNNAKAADKSSSVTVGGQSGSSNNNSSSNPSSAVTSNVSPTPIDSGNELKLPTSRWIPATPKYVSNETNRSAENYKKVIEQFDVENSKRYQRSDYTWCNIFAWDVTTAMGAEIPHWYDPVTGKPTAVGAEGAYEMGTRRMVEWMNKFGEQNGWRMVSAAEAQSAANSGMPTIALTEGHVAMVVPAAEDYDLSRGPLTTQAGASNFENKSAKTGFGSSFSGIMYYTHK